MWPGGKVTFRSGLSWAQQALPNLSEPQFLHKGRRNAKRSLTGLPHKSSAPGRGLAFGGCSVNGMHGRLPERPVKAAAQQWATEHGGERSAEREKQGTQD